MEKLTGKKTPAKKAAATKKPVAKKSEDKETAVVAASTGASAQDLKGDAYRVLVSPVITEKTGMQQSMGKYTFVVAKSATKVDVARAIKDLYGVKAESVRVVNVLGKIVRHGRFSGQRKDVKKAIVTLKKGDSIALAA